MYSLMMVPQFPVGTEELGTGNWELGDKLGTGNWGQGTWDRELGNLGQGTGDRELGTGNLGTGNWGRRGFRVGFKPPSKGGFRGA